MFVNIGFQVVGQYVEVFFVIFGIQLSVVGWCKFCNVIFFGMVNSYDDDIIKVLFFYQCQFFVYVLIIEGSIVIEEVLFVLQVEYWVLFIGFVIIVWQQGCNLVGFDKFWDFEVFGQYFNFGQVSWIVSQFVYQLLVYVVGLCIVFLGIEVLVGLGIVKLVKFYLILVVVVVFVFELFGQLFFSWEVEFIVVRAGLFYLICFIVGMLVIEVI